MLLIRRCVSLWRQTSEAAVSRSLSSSLRPFCSASTAQIGSEDDLELIRSRIFGTHIGNGQRSGRKVLRKKLIGDKIASYYPEPVAKYDPMFVDTNIERYTVLKPPLDSARQVRAGGWQVQQEE